MMKKMYGVLLAVVLCVGPVLVLVPGCASGSRNAYVTSGVTHVTARTALLGWNAYITQQYAAFAADQNKEKGALHRSELLAQEVQVKAAYQKYQAAQLAVLQAAQAFSRVPPENPEATNAEDRMVAAVAAAGVTMSALVGLIEQFGVKL